MPGTYSLVSVDEAATAAAEHALGAEGPLLSCQGACGIRIGLMDGDGITALRLRFAGFAAIDTWQSWYRAPVLPPPGALRLFVAGPSTDAWTERPTEERRFALDRSAGERPAPAQRVLDGALIELSFAPLPSGPQVLELRFVPAGYALLGLEAASTPLAGEPLPNGGGPELDRYPAPQPDLARTGDGLAAQLEELARREGTPEPTLDQVAQLALPYRGGALLGQVEGPIVYQSWDGGLIMRGAAGSDRAWYRVLLGDHIEDLSRSEQRLLRGYLPVAEVEQESRSQPGVTLHQIAFVDQDGDLRARFTVRGESQVGPPRLTERCARATLLKTTNEPWLRAQQLTDAPLETNAESIQIGGHAGQRTLHPARPEGPRGPQELWLPLSDSQRSAPRTRFEDALRAVEDEAEAYLASGVTLALPDPQLDRLWRALLLHNRLFVREGKVRYGLFPGVYDGGLFGVEEGWNIVALMQYGHQEEAERTLAATFFDPEFLKKEGQHHQYRNGLALTYLLDVVALGGSEAMQRALWPQVVESAEWIVTSLQSTQQLLPDGTRPVHYGLMPRHTYGGDLKDPAYSLYGSSACWRGLRDAAILAERLGDPHASRWRAAAAEARANLHITAERIYRDPAKDPARTPKDRPPPPFLPFRTDETADEPSARDYHQLFASLVLETTLFGWQGHFAQHLTGYLQQTGRQVLGVARFDQWFGRLGVDAEYSRGTQLCALHRRDFSRFWLGLLGQVGLSCDPATFVSPETAIVYFTAAEHHARLRTLAEQPCRFDSDPCSAGTAVMLQYLRYLLCTEERDEDDRPTGVLWLLPAAPPSWFRPGRTIAARGLPTALGRVSLRCESDERALNVQIETERELPIELFYCDARGARRSQKLTVRGSCALTLVHAE